MTEPRKAVHSNRLGKKKPRVRNDSSAKTDIVVDDIATAKSADIMTVSEQVTGSTSDSDESQDTDVKDILAPTSMNATSSQAPLTPTASVAASLATPRPDPSEASKEEGDEYTVQIYYDQTVKSFIASVLEIPDVRTSGSDKEKVIRELRVKVAQYLAQLGQRGESPPQAIFNRRYPDTLDVRLSQALFRKLDILSKQQRLPIDQLVTEIVSAAIEKRSDTVRPQPSRSTQSSNRTQQHGQQHDRRGGSQAQQPHNHQQSQQRHPQRFDNNRRPMRGRSYHDTMQNRENFMEYVRNLEKGRGGTGGGWKKR